MPGHSCSHCAEPVAFRDRFCEVCGAQVADQPRERVEADAGVAAGVSDRGLRHRRNEDALVLRGLASPGGSVTVAIVCDGVSSAARPDEASEAAAQAAAEALVAALRAGDAPAAATREAIHAAGTAVAGLADDQNVHNAPACTFVSAVVTGTAVTVGWIGDSRAYWIPRTGARPAPARLTEDDSWLARVVAAGTMAHAEAATDRRAHAITAWLGAGAEQVDPHLVTIAPDGPGVVVICTDGLWGYLDSVEELAAALPVEAFDAPLVAARELVEIALRGGGRDNITVAVIPCVTDPGGTS